MAKKESQNNLTLFDVMKKEVTYHNDFSNTIFTDFTLKEKQLLLFLIAGIKDTDPDNKVYSFNPKEVKRMLNMTRQSYSLDFTLKEKQLLLFLIAGIKDTDPDNKVYSFNPKEVKRMLNMTRQSYSLLSEFVFSLQKKPLTILKPNKKIEAISIFDKVVYSPNDESIDVKWGNSAIEFFKKFKTNFSDYFLENIIKLKNENSVEFYLKAESNLYRGYFDIEGEDIYKIFNVKYPDLYNVKRFLINTCLKDINKNTDINIQVKNKTIKRKIIGFTFSVVKYPDLYNVKRFLINTCLKDINKNTDINIQVKNKTIKRKIIGFTFSVRRKVSLSDELTKKIEKIKKNIYISRSGFFNKENLEKTLHKLFRNFSNEELIQGLELCYHNIKNDFSTFSYLKNAIKYALDNKEENKKEKSELKEVEIIDKNADIEDAIIVENSEKNDNLKTEEINSKGIENIQLITKVLDKEINIKEKIKNKEISLDKFEKLSEEEQALIESKALILFKAENKGQDNFLVLMKKNSPTMYYKTLEKYILETMKENLIEEAEIIQKNIPPIEAPIEKPLKKLEEKTLPKKRGRRKKLDMLDELDKNEEVPKNEKKIISFVKKIYGKEKVSEIILLKNEKKIEVFWSYYIELLKFNEEQKKK